MLTTVVLHYDLNMEREKLQKYIEELRAELEKLQDSDTEASSRLNTLLKNIETSVENDFPHSAEIGTSVQDNLKYFEATHPVITEALNRIATLFSNMGI